MSHGDFIKKLEESGLNTTALFLQSSGLQLPVDGLTTHLLAEELVKVNQLTEYQAQILLGDSSDRLVFGEYTIMDKVGQGGMGVVFKAQRSPKTVPVALKVLPQRLSDSETAIRRFTREAELARKLVHPNIVATKEFGKVDNCHYLVMEFIDGDTLKSYVKDRNGLPLLTSVEMLRDAVRGVNHAHQLNVIHRDIKPSNLLVTRDERLKVLDMGLARLLMENDPGSSSIGPTELTMTGTLLGTTGYMAPEQALNSKNADRRSDIYSLGCTFHFMLTGEEIYGGETFVEKIVAHREQPIPDLTALRDEFPSVLQKIFIKMVAKKPEDRYQATTELLDDLDNCIKDHGHRWMIKKFLSAKKRKP